MDPGHSGLVLLTEEPEQTQTSTHPLSRPANDTGPVPAQKTAAAAFLTCSGEHTTDLVSPEAASWFLQ